MEKYEIEELFDYQDQKADSRMDALLHSIDSIKFWVRIIGIYILLKLVICIIAIATKSYLITEIIKQLQ